MQQKKKKKKVAGSCRFICVPHSDISGSTIIRSVHSEPMNWTIQKYRNNRGRTAVRSGRYNSSMSPNQITMNGSSVKNQAHFWHSVTSLKVGSFCGLNPCPIEMWLSLGSSQSSFCLKSRSYMISYGEVNPVVRKDNSVRTNTNVEGVQGCGHWATPDSQNKMCTRDLWLPIKGLSVAIWYVS